MLMAKRIEKWDILKFFLIFTVVLGHLADYYTGDSQTMKNLYLFIYTFHMPLFIFVSGLFSKRTVNEKRFDKMAGYLIIYLFLKVLLALYKLVADGVIALDLFIDKGLPWFMFATFAFLLITCAVKKIKPWIVITVSLILALAVGYTDQVGDVLSLSRIIVFFPFFYLGYITDPEKLVDFTNKPAVKILSVAALIVLAVAIFGFGKYFYFTRPLFTGRNNYYTEQIRSYFPYSFLLRLGCYFVSFFSGLAIISVTPNHTKIPYISAMGTRTVSVYVYHYIVFYVLFTHLELRERLTVLLPDMILIVFVPLALAITMFLSLKWFSEPLEKLMLIPVNIRLKIKQKAQKP